MPGPKILTLCYLKTVGIESGYSKFDTALNNHYLKQNSDNIACEIIIDSVA